MQTFIDSSLHTHEHTHEYDAGTVTHTHQHRHPVSEVDTGDDHEGHDDDDRLIEALAKNARAVMEEGWCLVCRRDCAKPDDHDEECPVWVNHALLDEIKEAAEKEGLT